MYWLPYSSHTFHHPSQTPWLPWISYATQKLMFDSCKMLQKQSEGFQTFLWHFPSLKMNFIAYHSSTCPHCISEIHQLWQSGFCRVYSSCCCSFSFEPEIIKRGQLSHKMYSNIILKFQESTTILNACIKKVWKIIEDTTYIYIYIYIYIFGGTLVLLMVNWFIHPSWGNWPRRKKLWNKSP